jgi:hypothetical protein
MQKKKVRFLYRPLHKETPMLVKELIELLRQQPPKAVVVVNIDKSELGNGRAVKVVGLVDALRYGDDLWVEDYYPEFAADEKICEKVVSIAS